MSASRASNLPHAVHARASDLLESDVLAGSTIKPWPRSSLYRHSCRGGKGRTGSMCCAWLLYAREADDAEDALTLFGLERTDLSQGLRKIQGVDTPSQRRYVHQLNALLREQGAYLTPERAPEVGAPPSRLASDSSVEDDSQLTSDVGAAATSRGDASAVDEAIASPAAPQAEPDGAHGGVEGRSRLANAPKLVRPPACPRISLTKFELRDWYAKAPKGPLCCAVHLDRVVVCWSAPVRVPDVSGLGATPPVVFDLGGHTVSGDVRVSVFDLGELLSERRARLKKGLEPRLPFDRAPSGPWADTANARPGGGSDGKVDKKANKRVIAGKEVGCKFFLLFHTGFVSEAGTLPVALEMMDKAFKNKKRKYRPEGVATLHFGFVPAEEGDGAATSTMAEEAADGLVEGEPLFDVDLEAPEPRV